MVVYVYDKARVLTYTDYAAVCLEVYTTLKCGGGLGMRLDDLYTLRCRRCMLCIVYYAIVYLYKSESTNIL